MYLRNKATKKNIKPIRGDTHKKSIFLVVGPQRGYNNL